MRPAKIEGDATGLRRVSAHEIERAVTKALRGHVKGSSAEEHSSITDRELVERLVDRIIITSQMIEIQLRQEEVGKADKSSFEPVSDGSDQVSMLEIRICQVSDRRLLRKFGSWERNLRRAVLERRW
jgi:hypothetical protein